VSKPEQKISDDVFEAAVTEAANAALTRKAELQALLARVTLATGSDRLLDADIKLALAPTERGYNQPAKAYTASLDAVLALTERLLPTTEVQIDIKRHADGTGRGLIWTDEGEWYEEDCATPPLALLAALLKMLCDAESTV
jgi:hypothetical protein